ncbi:uncharacterized protein PV09_06260 [Verruconis gallopava]|uniref:DUF7223 domain-containing protein n=1 Tax=Verruconis gallopava TaxID=253628 RepID=A0A0D2A7C4_9PEZI|nr:uncharacterized protein PV09_06260 [Verruconis gallopava]KIW02450.1 hypothetical protein PV09_06260 [Verruconis gallopava]
MSLGVTKSVGKLKEHSRKDEIMRFDLQKFTLSTTLHRFFHMRLFEGFSDQGLVTNGVPCWIESLNPKLAQSISVPLLPQISFGCKNCTTNGFLEVLVGTFDVEPLNAFTPGDVLQNATVMLSLPDGFAAHIELGLNVSSDVSFSIPIIEAPVAGYTIPGVGKAGLFFSPAISVSFQANEDIQMGFGFEMNIPKNSFILLDLSTISNFTQATGFKDTTVKALPASVNASVGGSLTTSFQPNLVVALDLGSKHSISNTESFELGAQVATIIDAPALTFNLSRELRTIGQFCSADKSGMTTTVSMDLSLGMGIEAEVFISQSVKNADTANSDMISDLKADSAGSVLGLVLPSTSIPIVSKTITSTSTCLGEVKGDKTEGPLVITSVTPTPTSSAPTKSTPVAGSNSPGGAKSQNNAPSHSFVKILVISVITALLPNVVLN